MSEQISDAQVEAALVCAGSEFQCIYVESAEITAKIRRERMRQVLEAARGARILEEAIDAIDTHLEDAVLSKYNAELKEQRDKLQTQLARYKALEKAAWYIHGTAQYSEESGDVTLTLGALESLEEALESLPYRYSHVDDEGEACLKNQDG